MTWKNRPFKRLSILLFSMFSRWSLLFITICIVVYCMNVNNARGNTLDEIITSQELSIEYNPQFFDFILQHGSRILSPELLQKVHEQMRNALYDHLPKSKSVAVIEALIFEEEDWLERIEAARYAVKLGDKEIADRVLDWAVKGSLDDLAIYKALDLKIMLNPEQSLPLNAHS